eukprot:TRINITY_DN11235_c0_g1_i1.p2 TRINITY_DN11235_c0_g1~~TRINITY_DN11235_c0_g1_i1.p2  ORF type:complete len:134 (+),score=3.19 TRINITY_DN11235_c0_g1_i1:1598-1999(+)
MAEPNDEQLNAAMNNLNLSASTNRRGLPWDRMRVLNRQMRAGVSSQRVPRPLMAQVYVIGVRLLRAKRWKEFDFFMYNWDLVFGEYIANYGMNFSYCSLQALESVCHVFRQDPVPWQDVIFPEDSIDVTRILS